jgi:hypothetical protein
MEGLIIRSLAQIRRIDEGTCIDDSGYRQTDGPTLIQARRQAALNNLQYRNSKSCHSFDIPLA